MYSLSKLRIQAVILTKSAFYLTIAKRNSYISVYGNVHG